MHDAEGEMGVGRSRAICLASESNQTSGEEDLPLSPEAFGGAAGEGLRVAINGEFNAVNGNSDGVCQVYAWGPKKVTNYHFCYISQPIFYVKWMDLHADGHEPGSLKKTYIIIFTTY